MKVLIISDSFLFAQSIGYSLKNMYENIDIFIEDINNIDKKYENLYDILFFLRTKDGCCFEKVTNTKNFIKNIIVIDRLMDENILSMCIEHNINAYITDVEDEYEFKYIINKVLRGYKFYDSNIMYKIVKKTNLEIETLTPREEEVVKEVRKGLSNRDIANALGVSEFTVKKHLSNILYKLKLKNRKDIILYSSEK